MSCPRLHSQWSHSQWADYLDGRIATAERAALELHCAACVPCGELLAKLTASRAALMEAAAVDRRRFAPNRKTTERIWDALRFRIRRAAQPAVSSAQVRSILVSVCGPAAADQVLTARRAALVGGLCGDRVARLVEHAVSLADRERVA